MEDPFACEIERTKPFDYEQNPADPQKPTKTVSLTPFEPSWQ